MKRKLPKDPDGRNDMRAAWADAAIQTFRAETGTAHQDAVADLLCDLRHWCDRKGFNFDKQSERALHHYLAETGQPGPLTQGEDKV